MTQQNSSDPPRSDIDMADTLALLVARVDHLSNELKDLRIQQTVQQSQNYKSQDSLTSPMNIDMENVSFPDLDESSESEESSRVALTALVERSKRASLLNTLTLLISIIERRGYQFSDLLIAFADYADCQVNEGRETSSTWSIVGSFIKNAQSESKSQLADTTFLDSPLAEVGLSGLADPFNPSKRASLLKTVNNLTLVIFQQGYHFSELMLALADFVESKTNQVDNKTSWQIMKSYLESAAREAEARGRELP